MQLLSQCNTHALIASWQLPLNFIKDVTHLQSMIHIKGPLRMFCVSLLDGVHIVERALLDI
jgi:hypothetical protein